MLSNVSGNNANILGVHLLYPEKYPLKKPSVGLAVAAIYRSKGVNKAIEHYRSLLGTARDRWNFEEAEQNDFGYWLLKRHSTEDAITIFRLNVEIYLESPNSHDSLGDAFRAGGQLKEAIESYRKAVALAEATNHSNLVGYRKSLESAIKQLNSQK